MPPLQLLERQARMHLLPRVGSAQEELLEPQHQTPALCSVMGMVSSFPRRSCRHLAHRRSATDLRNRAATHLHEAMAEIRAAGA